MKRQRSLKIIKNSIIVIFVIALFRVNAFPEEPRKGNHTKVLLIGIDGLEWAVMGNLIKENKMPTFAKLMQNGAYGGLRTLLNYTSPSLWTTIATGRSPEAHGITKHIVHEKGLYEPISPMSYHRKVKALWNILSDHGRKVGVINYQCTEPAEAINGFIVPNSIVDIKEAFPSGLTEEIKFITESSVKTAKESFNDFEPYSNFQDKLSEKLKYHLVDGEIWRLSVITPYLYEKFNRRLDLLMVYLYETDYISHIFWKFGQPGFFQDKAWGLNPNDVKKYGNVINEMYQMVDKFVKKIIEDIADENTIIIICSDHGFRSGPSIPRISFNNLNKLLEKIGVLYFEDGNQSLGESEKITLKVDYPTKYQAYHYQLDEPHSHSSVFVSLNLKGREPNGVVTPGDEYIKLKKRLINALSDLTIIETKEKFFNNVSESSLPETDIHVSIKNDISLLKQHVKINGDIYPISDFYTLLDKSGDHSDPGVLIIYGKNIKKAKSIEDAHILDITPTILYLLGLPVAKDMEGKVLTQAIDANLLEQNPVKYIPTYEVNESGIQKSYKKYTPKPIEKEQLEKLKSLGYVQ